MLRILIYDYVRVFFADRFEHGRGSSRIPQQQPQLQLQRDFPGEAHR